MGMIMFNEREARLGLTLFNSTIPRLSLDHPCAWRETDKRSLIALNNDSLFIHKALSMIYFHKLFLVNIEISIRS